MTSVYVDEYLSQESFDEQLKGYVYEYSIPVEKGSVTYLSPSLNNQYMFWVNGEQLPIHDLANEGNIIYPGFFANGLITLGVYEDDTLELRICTPNPMEEQSVEIGFLSLEKLQASIDVQNRYEHSDKALPDGLRMKLSDVEAGSYLLLPMGVLDSYKLTINGRKGQTADPFCDALVMVALEEGNNELELRYVPKGLHVGIAVSCMGLVLLGLLLKFKNVILSWKWFSATVLYLYYLVYFGFLIIVYIIPIVATFIVKIKYRGV